MLISDLPLLNGREAGIERCCHNCLAKPITFPQGTNLFCRIKGNRFDTQNIILMHRPLVYEPELMQVLGSLMNRFQETVLMLYTLQVRPPPKLPPLRGPAQ